MAIIKKLKLPKLSATIKTTINIAGNNMLVIMPPNNLIRLKSYNRPLKLIMQPIIYPSYTIYQRL